MQLAQEVAVSESSFLKHSQEILGVKMFFFLLVLRYLLQHFEDIVFDTC
jgi:hypothetical protein